MCLIAFALHADPACPLLIAANRDESFERPTAALHRWALPDGGEVLGGRDLREGGTWLGLNAQGRVAMLTNVRQLPLGSGPRSRGELVTRWLQGDGDVDQLAEGLDPAAYSGFNLVVGDFHRRQWTWLSNRQPDTAHGAAEMPMLHRQTLAPGVYGLSNASLDTPWPKTQRLKQALHDSLRRLDAADQAWQQPLTRSLADRSAAPDAELPHTGVPDDLERALSSPFVHMPGRGYGTRSSLLVRTRPAEGGAGWQVEMDEWTHSANDAGVALAGAAARHESLRW
ncbi:NRDE family protein [Hydrogenophaga palleronii]|uniref:NRDE family protein n=1 Tax=Hydrogenophaga palleronii TaxID=65655 RepID=UPI00082431A6|nr:NRDE family protein [Hydrogenophaga palleronii]